MSIVQTLFYGYSSEFENEIGFIWVYIRKQQVYNDLKFDKDLFDNSVWK